MNGWVSILFTVVGGIMFLMKSKKDENGGGGYTVVNDNTPAPSLSFENVNLSEVDENDVIENPALLDLLKISEPEKYDEITLSIWQNPSYRHEYTRSTKKWVEIDDKEREVIKILEEGILKPYKVVKSQSGDYFIEVFVKDDENVGWDNGEKVGITQYAIILKTPDHSLQMIRDYELIDEFADYMYDAWIERFNAKYAQL